MSNPDASLATALEQVDWKKNVSHALSNAKIVETFDTCNLRIAIWSKQLENLQKGNAALCFIRDMQIAGQHAATCSALALYKPAASSMRAMVESALYHTYFRTHLAELTTLVRSRGFYVSKSDLLDYHKIHTEGFKANEQHLGLVQQLGLWYGQISGIIHGQLPGTWITHTSLSKLSHDDTILSAAADTFKLAEELVHKIFLCTVAQELWGNFSTAAKKELCKGLSAAARQKLGLDLA